MKIAVCSDLHLEFGTIKLDNPGVDVLILSGDILVDADLGVFDYRQYEMGTMPKRSVELHDFMQHCSEQFPHVVYVAGNHEHYHGDFAKTLNELKRKFEYLPNVHVLDKETFELDDYVFFGGTLWTDMNKEDPLTLHQIRKRMNDFRCVTNSSRMVNFRASVLADKPVGMTDEEFNALPESARTVVKFKQRESTFCAEDAVEDHKLMLEKLDEVYATLGTKKMIVVGHHAPSRQSTHPKYAHEYLMNGGYSSELSEFILDRPKIKLWTHGHTHELFDYMIGSTRVFCNPRGYDGYEEMADLFELKVVEV
jgi:Icc-related predicted phosphoesterase